MLTVVCVPACDEVLDNGRRLGPSPIFKVPTVVGSHRLTLRVLDPPSTKVVEVTVNEDETTTVRQAMD
jgi:serine/threonine-protein kinase